MSNQKAFMKKILFIVDDLGQGGAEKITLELAKFLAKNTNLVTLAVLNSSKNTLSIHSSIEYIDLSLSPKFSFGKLWKSKKISKNEEKIIHEKINSRKFDLIIIGFHNGYYLGKYITQKTNVWYWVHGDLLEYRPSTNIFIKLKENIRQLKNKQKFKKLFSGKNLITVNLDLKLKYQSLLPNSTIIHIPNGVSSPNPPISNKKNKLWDIVFVGRLAPIKQVDHILLAFSKSSLTGKLAIVGDGNQKSQLIQYAQQLNIIDRVDFIGWVNNPYPYMLQAKSLVLTSHYEAYGLVLAESLCLDTPVIAYNCSTGVRDILSLQKNMLEYLVEPNNHDLLAKKMFDCVVKPYPILGTTKKKLSIQNTAENFLNLLNISS